MPEQQLIEAEPPAPEIDPTDLTRLFFRQVDLSEDEENRVTADLMRLYEDAVNDRGDLDQLLAHWNDMAEGIAQPKDFPWPNCSNLFVPLAETHLNNVHSAARQTMMKGDQLWYVRSIGYPSDPQSANKAEQYLNYKSLIEVPLVDRFSQATWCALRDGTAVAQVQWLQRREPVLEILDFSNGQQFTDEFPTPKSAGLSARQYDQVLQRIVDEGRASIVVSRDQIVYNGPTIDIVQLSDFLMAPMTSITTRDAWLLGKRYEIDSSTLKDIAEEWNWRNVDDVLNRPEDGKRDLSTTLKDQIEGIYRRPSARNEGPHVLFDGIHRFDLEGTGVRKRYLAIYHPLSKKLLNYLEYPYIHGQDCFVPIRVKKRPKRFLGRGLCQMLDDINSEVNTQHNQRIDSRTITTVPTFKAKYTAKGQIGFDPSRADSRFYPGKFFYVTELSDFEQLKITQTDLSETLQEESTLFQLADGLTGSSQLRSGKETKADPRAPAAKVNLLLNQSNVRLDDYFEELAGNAIDNEGFNAIGAQMLELYYQFHDPDLGNIPMLKSNGLPELGPDGQPQSISVNRGDLRVRGRLRVAVAKTSASMNPDSLYLKFLQIYSLLVQDPLVGGRLEGRLALDRKLLTLAREENPDELLPNDQQLQEMKQQQQQQALAAAMAGKAPGGSSTRGPGSARNRGGSVKPSTPSGGGSTRPMG